MTTGAISNELPLLPLAEWLAHTHELVPADDERSEIDWDAATTDLRHEPQAHCD
ncbi:hypothetical protein AB0D34_42150 [Streptomyces sp. NPDC048420]|uniref:hypothetical protein n=1 Tax=Streptomyces sp. NPDC048420 TaxID=3155755 RepID=UPI00341FE0F2